MLQALAIIHSRQRTLDAMLEAIQAPSPLQVDLPSLHKEIIALDFESMEAWCFVLVSGGLPPWTASDLFPAGVLESVVAKTLNTAVIANGAGTTGKAAFMKLYRESSHDYGLFGDETNGFNGCADARVIRRVLQLPHRRTVFIRACSTLLL